MRFFQISSFSFLQVDKNQKIEILLLSKLNQQFKFFMFFYQLLIVDFTLSYCYLNKYFVFKLKVFSKLFLKIDFIFRLLQDEYYLSFINFVCTFTLSFNKMRFFSKFYEQKLIFFPVFLLFSSYYY
ncbi:hypothetical protein IMG5_054870 [Ichthyophthirius multifiliis]|uniref:Transmembrane protein n=1 Tax=Ichthyophthirius multifiliis TaxID=5932 RepID=G0QN25_ICHMU|nr:hypothetical protein IMG5_054870 [Ichthyophthirius multifiliis]EGR33378.1 hypothetical protein IMG5_054870 [Ichthyophthirius multifiliis]|eukprot:XP_004037364.1 hypothetical protein IMG5_054870 [Ichthyophthirius multifiliis]